MHTMCKIDEGIVIPNFAALRAAVFPLSAKNLRGGRISAPPLGARVNGPDKENRIFRTYPYLQNSWKRLKFFKF